MAEAAQPYPAYKVRQPVPWEQIPAAPGSLPAWSNKKLELEMLAMQIEQNAIAFEKHQSAQKMQAPTSKNATTSPSTPGNGSSTLKKTPSMASRPSFLEAFRNRSNSTRNASSSSLASSGASRSTRTVSTANDVRNNPANRSASTVATSNDSVAANTQSRAAVDYGPNAKLSAAENAKRQKNPFIRFFAKRFSSSSTGRGIEGGPQVAERQRQQAQQTNAGVAPVGGMHKVTNSKGIGHTGGIASKDSGRKTKSNGFAEKMRLASGKAKMKLQNTWRRFNSKTPKEELPKTWDEWRRAYARGDIDVSDLPPPPTEPVKEGETNPLEAENFAAPLPENHRERQLAVNRLDWEGKRGTKASAIPVQHGEEPLPDSLEGHPAFRAIVAQAREVFGSAISILTVFNENKQLFLAETGLGGMREVPREVTFCSHAVLQRPVEPFILTDTHKDWRFAKSPLVQQYGCRAYYGVPLLAPDFSGSGGDVEQIPIGTLCVIDNKPRDAGFTNEQRSKMGDLALLAQKTIANWSRARLQARLANMEESFQTWRNETAELGPAALSEDADIRPLSIQAAHPDTDGASPSSASRGVSAAGSVLHISARGDAATPSHHADVASTVATTNADASFHTPAGTVSTAKPDGTTTSTAQGTSTEPRSNKQRIYDISTRLIANSLELSLVYILQLNMTSGEVSHIAMDDDASFDEASRVQSLGLISAYGLPDPEPAFDAVLHLKALKSAEGGLLYQNPAIEDLEAGERLPKSGDDVEYASALLVPIYESEDQTKGYVLAGFTDDPERVFERSDLEYMATLASELSVYLQD